MNTTPTDPVGHITTDPFALSTPPAAPAPAQLTNQAILDQLAVISAQLAAANAYLADLRDIDPGRRIDTRIVDANMPFSNLVGLLVKIALASIPAVVIVSAVIFFIIAMLGIFGISLL